MEVRARVVIQENERDWKSIKGINSSWFPSKLHIFYNKSVYQSIGEAVAKYIKDTDSVLEFACGTGAISMYIAPVCNTLFASDY